MNTTHKVLLTNSNHMDSLPDNSVDLIMTSPPYPMIEMWDEIFIYQNPAIKDSLNKKNGIKSFNFMN